ncbi:hypothetical protein JCM8097_008809 [Rhodosporidiobolus ruineniae]
MDSGLYDPPLASGSLRRGRSASLCASSAPQVFSSSSAPSRRQSLSSFPTAPPAANLSDEEDASHPPSYASFPHDDGIKQAPEDAAADRKVEREGRQSKQRMMEEHPELTKGMTGDMEQFMAQLFDLTHSIDALEDDVDETLALRNKIVQLDPRADVGQVSLRSDLDAHSSLTTQTGKTIVSLETWLLQLHAWAKQVKRLVKEGKAGETLQEVAEIKYQLAGAKLDFADAMERIREGAWKEQERRERTRIWMAKHIRQREPEIEDRDVKGLLKAAELGAADGVCHSDVTSYAGLWAHQNPFTELAELTNGMRFLHDDLDKEIVDAATGKSAKKRVIYLDKPTSSKKSKSSSTSKRSSSSRKKSSSSKRAHLASSSSAPPPQSSSSWFPSRLGLLTSVRSAQRTGQGDDAYERRFRYIQAEQYAAEKDLEYGFARQAQMERVNRRKKLVIALLLVIIVALILFVVLATMKVPDQAVTLSPSASSSTSDPFAVTTPSAPAAEATQAQTQEQDPQKETFSEPALSTASSADEAATSSIDAKWSSRSAAVASSLSVASAASFGAGQSTSAATVSSSAAYNNGLWTAQATTAATATTQATTQQTIWCSCISTVQAAMATSAPLAAQKELLAAFPLVALGLVGIAFAVFLLSIGRINRAHLNLWIALGSAFVAGLFQLANALQADVALVGPPRKRVGLAIVQGIALGFFLNFKHFFLYRRSSQPGLFDPPTPNFPLPLALQAHVDPEPKLPSPEPALVVKLLKRIARPLLWVMILTGGFVDSTWRFLVRTNPPASRRVNKASVALQLVTQTIFLVKILVKAARSPGRPRAYVFLSYLPLLVGLVIGLVTAIIPTDVRDGQYIFLLETSLIDYKRPYRDSFSFEPAQSPSKASPTSPSSDHGLAPPVLSRSPLDRAALVANSDFSSFRLIAQQSNPSSSSLPSQAYTRPRNAGVTHMLTPSDSLRTASTTGPVLRRASRVPSWLPLSRRATDRRPSEQEERLSLTVEAAPMARRNGMDEVREAEPEEDRSLLYVQQVQRQPLATSTTEATLQDVLSAYRFPESVAASEEGCPAAGGAVAMSGLPPPSSSPSSSRRFKPALTINTALSAPSTASSRVRTSKPLPDLPNPPPRPAAAPSEPTPEPETTSTGTTLDSSTLAALLPAGLQNPTRPLDLPSNPPLPWPRLLARSSSTPTLAGPFALPYYRQSAGAISMASTARSSSLVHGASDSSGGEGRGGDALDRFPYPPSTSLLRTQSGRTGVFASLGRTGTLASLGRVKTREGSEFDLVAPVLPFAGGGGSREGSEESLGVGGAAAGGGVDVTSLIVGTDEAHELKERLETSSGAEEETPTAGRKEDGEVVLPLPLPLARPADHPLTPIPAVSRPSRIPAPPRTWPPAAAAAPSRLPQPAQPTHTRSPASLSSSYSASATIASLRRPSAVALAAARIRAEGESLLPRPVTAPTPPPATPLPLPPPVLPSPPAEPARKGSLPSSTSRTEKTPATPGTRLRRFVFPNSGSSANAAAGASSSTSATKEKKNKGGEGGRMLVAPPAPFEHPRRVPSQKGERFSPVKRAEGEESGGESRRGSEDTDEGGVREVHVVVGKGVGRASPKRV